MNFNNKLNYETKASNLAPSSVTNNMMQAKQ